MLRQYPGWQRPITSYDAKKTLFTPADGMVFAGAENVQKAIRRTMSPQKSDCNNHN
jgi:hypothetical protein